MATAKVTSVPPVLVLGVATLLFGAWVASESAAGAGRLTYQAAAEFRDTDLDADPPELPSAHPGGTCADTPDGPPDRPHPGGRDRHGPPPELLLGALHPGRPRAAVERHLRSLPSAGREPIESSTGGPLVRMRYLVTHLMAHPIHSPPGPHVLTLDFDGLRGGQPLVRAELVPVF
jgi:hypothetical protein